MRRKSHSLVELLVSTVMGVDITSFSGVANQKGCYKAECGFQSGVVNVGVCVCEAEPLCTELHPLNGSIYR